MRKYVPFLPTFRRTLAFFLCAGLCGCQCPSCPSCLTACENKASNIEELKLCQSACQTNGQVPYNLDLAIGETGKASHYNKDTRPI